MNVLDESDSSPFLDMNEGIGMMLQLRLVAVELDLRMLPKRNETIVMDNIKKPI